MSSDPRVLGSGFVILKAKDERRARNGTIENPPQLFVVWYDPQFNQARIEPISFGAAEALAPDKFALAMDDLQQAREKDGYPS